MERCHASADVVCAHAGASMPLSAGLAFIVLVVLFIGLTAFIGTRIPSEG